MKMCIHMILEKNYKNIKSILPFVNENLKKYLNRKDKLRIQKKV